MARLLPALAAAAATLALAGCVLSPPALQQAEPLPPLPQPSQPSQPTQPSQSPGSPSPSTPSDDAATAEGSTATLSSEGTTWQLELLELGPAPLDQLTEYGGDEGAPAPAPPAGYEVGWACFRMTVVEAPDGYASLVSVVHEFSVPGGEDAWDYEVIDLDNDMFAASGAPGDVLERVCPVLVVPEGFAYDAVTATVRTESGDLIDTSIAAP